MGRKFRGAPLPVWAGGAGSPSNTKSPGPRPSSIPSDILIMQPFGRNRCVLKIGGLCPFEGGGASPHLTQCARAEAYLPAKFHLDPSNRLATVHERHRQDRQRTDSIVRTVLQTVAQKAYVTCTITRIGSMILMIHCLCRRWWLWWMQGKNCLFSLVNFNCARSIIQMSRYVIIQNVTVFQPYL